MSEREEWEDLISSPGFARLTAYAKAQYGPVAYARRLKQAIAKAQAEKTDVGTAVTIVDSVQTEINAFLTYPALRIEALQEQEAKARQEPALSRRGPL